MHSSSITIDLLDNPKSLADLEVDAKIDGHIIVSRFIQEWNEGINRFDRVGEKAYVARIDGRVCSVCGLNIDPFAQDDSVGRVRRLYVAMADRRNGIGSAIMRQLLIDARGVFQWIHLRTHAPQASAFYESIGFERVAGNPECTHRLAVQS